MPTGILPNESNNAYTAGADLFKGASEGFDRFSGGLLTNINDYINPYYERVVNDTLGRMGDERTKAIGQIGDAASAAGSFGGSRHALLESDVYSEFDRNMYEYVNRANADAFSAGGNLYNADLTGQIGMSGAMSNLGNTYLGIGNQVQAQQAGYGQMQRDLVQQIMSGNAGMWNQMTSSPHSIINMLNGVMQMDPRRNAGLTTQSTTPGLFDYLSLAAQAVGG